jgi:hypothetical protein
MEDYYHHFAITVAHATVIDSIEVTPVRTPWATCVGGIAGAQRLVGLTIAEACDQKRWGHDPSEQCTHVADLCAIAVRHALDGEPLRYEVLVRPPATLDRTAWLFRNGQQRVEWRFEGDRVRTPGPLDAMAPESRDFLMTAREHLDARGLEEVMVLRRACRIAFGCGLDLDDFPTAGDVYGPDGSCHTYRPDIAPIGLRNIGSGNPGVTGPFPSGDAS